MAVVGVHTFNSATSKWSTIWGNGDLFVRTEINVWGNDGGTTALAVIPYIKAPTAAPGIGNGAVEEGLIAPLWINLPSGFTFAFNSEIDGLKDSVGDGQHANYINVVNMSHQVIIKDLTLYVELWSDYDDDPMQRTTQVSLDTALALTVRPNLLLDIGADFGLNGATPAIQVFAGISQRF